MNGIGFDSTHLIWIAACVALNIVIFGSIKAIGKVLIEDIKCQAKFKKILSKSKSLNIILWIIIISVMVTFFGTKKYVPHQDMGARTTQNEAREHEQLLPEVIEDVNLNSIKEKEDLIGGEVKKEQRKSSEDYEIFLKETMKNIEKEQTE